MTIHFEILGAPGSDNALLVRVDSGQSMERLLFDCGEGCLANVTFSEIQAVDHLFFSHLHMDHVGGFDTFFRAVYYLKSRPNQIWGPPDTARILQHRFQGFLWNLHKEMSASWLVTDIAPDTLRTTRFELAEAFATPHEEKSVSYQRVIVDKPMYSVEAVTMQHRTPTIAYVVREKPRNNIDMARLASLGLRPGTWMKPLKDRNDPTREVTIDGKPHLVDELRKSLLVESPGDSIAYLTDFLLDSVAMNKLAKVLAECQTIVCEAQYRHADLELAHRNFHMTTVLTGQLAARVGAKRLVLFHLSDRYTREQWTEMLREARQEFPAAEFAASWKMPAD